ncbi:alpha/beta hydrolase [Herbaspirillum sp. RTI4]|uniref:alpha/beta fold hydrolase n=1 Tax=Herbaspirillum sp. RTI4 TaxID=3048640 RepID=UPI002AB4B755|nr:alpha/beta hydrolase [Herbaspirillum sp. RTI4]MDY7578412.1 alpha/beta hydrolase [Herbaspirillum sp. RTI4]MEA9982574.1 alpha/beta hydrolase [Herbaspirillum sp. RTI4]
MTLPMTTSEQPIRCAHIQWREREIALEYQWVGAEKSDYPVVVFLHEGLGSIALWKDFPQQFCAQHGLKGLVFSRYGYGNSTPRPADERFPVDFMHQQAREVLPLFFKEVGVTSPWLFGHSDGGSIALLYAAFSPEQVSGIVVVAPHIFVEQMTVEAIAEARQAYLEQGLRGRIARYHTDVDSAFWGWNDVWLDPAFRSWDIEALLPAIRCPVLAVQGDQDEYGTMAQIQGIQQQVPHTVLSTLTGCGHSPHREQAEALSFIAANFITKTA